MQFLLLHETIGTVKMSANRWRCFHTLTINQVCFCFSTFFSRAGTSKMVRPSLCLFKETHLDIFSYCSESSSQADPSKVPSLNPSPLGLTVGVSRKVLSKAHLLLSQITDITRRFNVKARYIVVPAFLEGDAFIQAFRRQNNSSTSPFCPLTSVLPQSRCFQQRV